MPLIPAAHLRTISINIFTAIGLKPDKAQTITNLLIEVQSRRTRFTRCPAPTAICLEYPE